MDQPENKLKLDGLKKHIDRNVLAYELEKQYPHLDFYQINKLIASREQLEQDEE